MGRALAVGSCGVLIAAGLVPAAQAIPSSYVEMDGNIVKDGTGTYDWSNGGTRTSTATAQGTRFSRPTAGGLFDGGTFVNATTPPLPPALTSAAAADATLVASAFKPDPLSVDVTSCGTGDPTSYTGAGSEVNGGTISTDTFGTSSVPNKDDLSNVYAAAHIGTGVNEVFFGGERVSNNGDSHIDYEFLQSTVTIPNACSGSFSGHRTKGDFLASIDFTAGGTFGGQHIYKWVCGNVTPNATTGVCDPTRSKGGPRYEEVTDNAVLTALKVNVNGAALDCGGWACRNSDGTSTATIPTNGLMEGAIDLQQLGFTGCLSTFLPHTRSSQSFTAVLKDFEIIPFNTCAHPTITTAIADASGTPLTLTNGVAHASLGTVLRDTSTLHGFAGTPTGSVTYKLYNNATCTGTTPATGLVATLTPTPNALVNGAPPMSNTFTFNDAGNYWFIAAAAFTDNRNLGTPNSGCAAEPLVIAPATPDPHSTPVVQIKDTLNVTDFSSNATGNILVGLYTNSACTTRASGTSDESFTVAQATAGAVTSFVTVTAGNYYYKISYAGDNNNTGFSDCTETVGVAITSLP